MTEKVCTLPGGSGGDSEWCREYCLNWGWHNCTYDPKTDKVMVKGWRNEKW